MDKLKSSIEEANLAVDAEREKNVSLLHLIFPPDIAKRLWLGKLQRSISNSIYIYQRYSNTSKFLSEASVVILSTLDVMRTNRQKWTRIALLKY